MWDDNLCASVPGQSGTHSFVRLLTRLLINPMSAVEGRLSLPPCVSPPSPPHFFSRPASLSELLTTAPYTVTPQWQTAGRISIHVFAYFPSAANETHWEFSGVFWKGRREENGKLIILLIIITIMQQRKRMQVSLVSTAPAPRHKNMYLMLVFCGQIEQDFCLRRGATLHFYPARFKGNEVIWSHRASPQEGLQLRLHLNKKKTNSHFTFLGGANTLAVYLFFFLKLDCLCAPLPHLMHRDALIRNTLSSKGKKLQRPGEFG